MKNALNAQWHGKGNSRAEVTLNSKKKSISYP